MRCQHLALLLVAGTAVLASCRKDKDEEAPSIRITAPSAAYTAVIPDTVTVVAEISDNERITSVTFSVVDAQGFPVTAGYTVEPSSNPATITVQLPLTSELILSGPHEVKVVASDGDNRGTASRVISVIGIPRRLRSIYVLTRPSSTQVTVHRIDSTGALGLVTTLGQDLNVAAVSSKGQRLFLGGALSGPLTALFPDNGSIVAQLAGANTLPIPYFTALDMGLNGLLFAATNDGNLRRLNKDLGGTGYQADALSNYRITHVLELADGVLTTQAAVASADQQLVRYSPVGGVQTDIQALDKVPVALFPRDDDHVLLFGNRSGEGVIEDRNVNDGGYWEPRVFTDPITAVVQLDANTYVVAVNSALVRFTYSNAGVLTIASGITAQQLAYNEVSGELIVAEGPSVSIMDPSDGTVITTYVLPDNAAFVLPLYNR